MKKKVVFIPGGGRIRVYKLAKSLKQDDRWEVILLCSEGWYDEALFDGVFDKVFFFRKKRLFDGNKYAKYLQEKFFSGRQEKLIRKLKALNPDLVHALSEPYGHIEAVLKKTDYPVILSDGNDFSGISEGVEDLDPRVRQREKFVFENVHGICHKGPGYELEYYREHGYKVTSPNIRWFDHCDEDLFVDPGQVERLSQKDGEIHLVYTGTVSDDPGKRYVNYIPLARALNDQKVHLHIYSSPQQVSTHKRYKALDRELPYFHFHASVPYSELSMEIARYDWGLWWHEPTGERRATIHKQKVAIGNKMFSYLEAALPIIVGDHNGGGRPLIEEKGIGITMNKGDYATLGKKLEEVDKEKMDENVIKARKEWSLVDNGKRLTDFYEKVLKTHERE